MQARKKPTKSAELSPVLSFPPCDACHPQMRLWMFRLLFRLGLYKLFLREKDFFDDNVARALGFGAISDGEPGAPAFDRQQIIGQMRAKWQEEEERYAVAPVLTWQAAAFRRLGERIGLSDIECDIVAFRMACEQRELRSLTGLLGNVTMDSLLELLSACLGREAKIILDALSSTSSLMESGIIALNAGRGSLPLKHSFEVLDCLTEEIHRDHDDPLIYFRSRIVRSASPQLTKDNFPHVARDIDVLIRFLGDASARRQKGVNVLIHGDPGSGKTEFARMIAAQLGSEMFEVAVARRNGKVLDADERFRAYRLGQALLGKAAGRLVLFDEIEDVFQESDRGAMTGSNRSQRKAWVNKLMESNPVPSFWITNNIWVIDRSFMRRFDYVLELNAPPRSVRGRVLDDYLADIPVSDAWKRKMSEHESLMPAVVERAAKVVRAAKDDMPHEEIERSLSRVLGNTLEAMGLPREPRHWAPAGGGYRLDVLNTDCDIEQVKTGLTSHRQGRVCLYGPPGTGKTAFGRYIAEVLDRPLLVRRASDIISPWVGMTEKNLAKMFRQAFDEEAVLLLDEADSFLQDRQGAQRNWEITEVNEMLTQMESFEGVFIASTNLMTSLDAAALRRFDLKIHFDYLKPGQAWALFRDTGDQLGIQDALDLESAVGRIGHLTPGDFANVVRQARLRPVGSSDELLRRLQAECEMKPEGRRQSMGFTT